MSEIQNLVKEVTIATNQSLKNEVAIVPLDLWNESVYRYQWIKQLLKVAPKARCQIEWNYNDLFFQLGDDNVIVEFKFYITQFNVDIHGNKRDTPKGHPSNKNFEEFCVQIGKLDKMNEMVWFKGGEKSITHKLLILVYTDNANYRKKQFKHWYDSIKLLDEVKKPGKKPLKYDLRNVKFDTFYEAVDNTLYCESSSNYIYCKLFEVK
ncbi:hypothetical protein [Pontibacter chinhatensis]|uniref:Uncharacterized protein n=1 Tax=Pontibacter chinhatensis TaxID=1436961 RepID=A0A1I2QMW9_9BACT|nr:hypothetical protein [Pontibacter chinhatensis]SFG29792.1 hypothetical protein SAMN05421739_10261 [Pontibacter chinhatensis]